MSSIDKLLIRGIRSFSPYQENVIEFYTPLTIIVGHNGAGKTTVIECLKYATTGDLPPNSKGGAFVHDPKVSREVEVKGQIKLKFKNVRSQIMVCTRSLQSTQKKSKLEQKTLESLLSTTDPTTGEQISISSRCAEMDAEVPLQLGVSRAVLENVLFCHQEESFWPLSEPSVLKKKFDDIFSATRYTKALDTLKSLKKDLIAEVKLEQQKLDFLKSDKDKANKLMIEMEKNSVREQEGRERITAVETQLSSITEVIQRLANEIQTLAGLQSEIERLAHDLETAGLSRDDLSKGLVLMTESDDSLLSMLEEFSKRSSVDESYMKEMKGKKSTIEEDIFEESRKQNAKMTEIRVLEAELKHIERRKKVCEDHILLLCNNLTIPINNDLDITFHVIKAKLEGQEETLIHMKKGLEESESNLNQKIQQLGSRQSSLVEIRRIKRKIIDETQIKLCNIIEEISEGSGAKEQIDDLQLRLLDEESGLNEAKCLKLAANFDGRLSALNEKRREIETEISQLNARISAFTRLSDVRAKFELKKADYEREIDILNKLHIEIGKLNEGLGKCPIEDVEHESERLWRTKEKETKALQEQYEALNQSASLANSRLGHARNLMDRKQRELNDKQRRIHAVCGEEKFSVYYEEIEDDLATISKELTTSISSKDIFESFRKTFIASHNCPLCERKFDSRMDEELFGRKLTNFISNLPGKTLEFEDKQRKLEESVDKLKALRPINDDVERLKFVEIPELQNELIALENERNTTQGNLDDMKPELSNGILEEKKLSSIRKRSEELGKLLWETQLLKGEVMSLESDLTSVGFDSNLDEIQSCLKASDIKRSTVQREIDQTSEDLKGRQYDLSNRESRYHDLKDQIMRLRLKESDLTRLEQSKIELESQIETINQEINAIDREAEIISVELSRYRGERQILLEQENAKIADSQKLVDSCRSALNRFIEMDSELKMMQEKYNITALDTLTLELGATELSLSQLQTSLDSINGKISLHNKATSEAIVQERNIRDNLRVREITGRIASLEANLARMRSRICGFNHLSVSDQLQRQELRRSELLGERSGIFGELRQIGDQTTRLRHEFESDYKNVEDDYRLQYIKFNATTTAIEDLEKYAKALDQAIMKFHSYKMSEVNRIIKEIWTTTYQGADIDTIEIRADAENAVGGRSYNYRVVMCKGETDLDMRGRSSAGQRVLASLIIRLALAETFGQHCGVIALDEPTTNLDRDNIESLANSLAEIIKMRGAQGNFQLIIITHDEEFVELLGRHECADYYWRVFKDENQYSTIERQSLQSQ